MKLALIRHGHALPHATDNLRHLSKLGQGEILETSSFLKASGIPISELIHSPLKRAIETCHLLSSSHFQEALISESGELKPLSHLSFWLNEITLKEGNTALIGHNPFLSHFAQELTGKISSLPTGGCLILERTPTHNWKVIDKNF